MYVKIKDNKVEQYPYALDQLLAENPDTSFPIEMPDSLLTEYNVFSVEKVDPPAIDYRQILVQGEPVIKNGKWYQVWNVIDKPTEDIEKIESDLRLEAYRKESDPLFFKWQAGEIPKEIWIEAREAIKQRYPVE